MLLSKLLLSAILDGGVWLAPTYSLAAQPESVRLDSDYGKLTHNPGRSMKYNGCRGGGGSW